MAACHLNLGNSKEVYFYYGKTLSLDPENYEALTNLANLKFKEKSYQLAFNLYSKATKDGKIEFPGITPKSKDCFRVRAGPGTCVLLCCS